MHQDRSPTELVDELTSLLDVRPTGTDIFEGPRTPDGLLTGAGRIYGGQVIAQALAAAAATVPEDRMPHSLHSYFLRMGNDTVPVDYAVARDLDGGTFSNRRVVATQAERTILSLTASFQRHEDSIEHQDEMPKVPGPDGLPSDVERRREMAQHLPEERRAAIAAPRPIDQRSVEQVDLFDPVAAPPQINTWIRAVAPLGDDPRLHCAILAYASDLVMLPTATLPHGLSWFRREMHEASLDHSIWFHDDFRMDEWLLISTHSPWARRGRGLITAKVFRQDGRLVASVAQEGMVRLLKPS
ncbi:MAG: acyl-CoA thioesterase II [Novosphingobium sp.]|nr:acyl-CoA thioesterase II [Novosphingobium sp.]